MRQNQEEQGEFYRRLSLLLQSELPLPESLLQLSLTLRKKRFRRAALDVAAAVAAGETLSRAMRHFPSLFPENHCAAVAAGEASDNLPAALYELSLLVEGEVRTVAMARRVLLYPSLVLALGVLLMAPLLHFLFKSLFSVYAVILSDNFWSRPHGLLLFLRLLGHMDMIGLFLLVLGAVWFGLLFAPGAGARALLFLLRMAPGFSGVFSMLEHARLCRLWSMVPEPEFLRRLSCGVGDSKLRRQLIAFAAEVGDGVSIPDALRRVDRLEVIVEQTCRHVPEAELPREMAKLADFFDEQFQRRLTRLERIVETTATLLLALLIGGLIVVIFLYLRVLVYY